jgi:hypothetical protein
MGYVSWTQVSLTGGGFDMADPSELEACRANLQAAY